MSVVFPPGHPLDRRRVIRLDDLPSIPLILQFSDSSVRRLLDLAFESTGRAAIPIYEATLMTTAVGMVKAHLGVAVVSSTSAHASAELAGLRVKPIRHEGLVREISIVQKAGRSPSPAVVQFIRVLREVCATFKS